MSCKDLDSARRFCEEVKRLAKNYDANFFIVTDGASAIVNNGNPAVKHAREAHAAWELENGGDPDEDWSSKYSKLRFPKSYNESALSRSYKLAIGIVSAIVIGDLVKGIKNLNNNMKRIKYISIAKKYYDYTNPNYNIADCLAMSLSQDDIKEILEQDKKFTFDESCKYKGHMFVRKKRTTDTLSADDFFGGIIECYNAETGKNDTFPICMSASKSGIPMKEIENIMLLLGGYMNTDIEWNIRKMQDELRKFQLLSEL